MLVSRAKNRRIARIVLVTMVGLTSLLFAAYLSLHHARATFYWMPWRAFEFMIGAAVIWLEVAVRPRGRLWPEIMAAGGLGMIIVPFLAYTDHTPFPFPGALSPCIGTALLIWAGGSCLTVETVDQPAHDLDRPYLLFALSRALAADHLLHLLAVRPTDANSNELDS